MLYHLVAEISRKVYERGLTVGNGGNVSVRAGEYMRITPKKSGFKTLADLSPYEIIRVPIDNPEHPRASSESKMHAEIYRRTNRKAVIHAHPPIACSKLHKGIIFRVPDPEGRYHDVPFIKYYPPGSRELARAVAEAIDDLGVVLMLNHGVVVAGNSLREALIKLELVELGARL